MCHPFHQILSAQSPVGEAAQESYAPDDLLPEVQSRRTWFGSLVAAGAAAMTLFKASSYATAQVGSSVAEPGKVTTQALGEEGSGYPSPNYPGPSDPSPGYPPSNYPSPSYPWPSYPSSPSGPVTTQALGEEGACCPPPPYRYPRGQPTTYALGEEGSRYYRLPRDYYRPRSSTRPGTVTTFALGEEGGTYQR